MKFSTIFGVAALAMSASAKTLAKRDIATIKDVFSNIGDLTEQFTKDVEAFTDDPTKLASDAQSLLAAIKSGTTKIDNGGDISTNDALELKPVVDELTKQTTDAVNALLDKKDDLVQAGAGKAVYDALTAQEAASKELADTTTSKVPEQFQALAAQLSKGIQEELAKGAAAFKGASGGSSSPTTTSDSSSTTTKAGGSTTSTSKGSETTKAPETTKKGAETTTDKGTAAPSSTPTDAAAINRLSGAAGLAAIVAVAAGL